MASPPSPRSDKSTAPARRSERGKLLQRGGQAEVSRPLVPLAGLEMPLQRSVGDLPAHEEPLSRLFVTPTPEYTARRVLYLVGVGFC